ncbi:uncharacterized protein K452DRAFT_83209 [Aplosporella prunicola CBS 121167]|uniref:Uncharacterized protein n=1 Tax=Aplosporella prunicola CBS 121167 TaxID=1176127 RepID=A0A6A6B4D2_9PEZI|nr:uncharacterized protein K452DRAFT_83209 [Aplosporella prunicola CBS 121167]KAF2138696.1 hypothetical protein K452DRAFT_83209 [Aplosporella prunicola CBS 121167]
MLKCQQRAGATARPAARSWLIGPEAGVCRGADELYPGTKRDVQCMMRCEMRCWLLGFAVVVACCSRPLHQIGVSASASASASARLRLRLRLRLLWPWLPRRSGSRSRVQSQVCRYLGR